MARWRDALQLLPLAEEAPAQAGTHIRVLFQPAFHAPGCLTLHIQPQAGTSELILPGPSVCDWVRQTNRQRDRALVPPPRTADLYWVAAPVPGGALERFQGAVTGIPLTRLGDTRPGGGRDGMLIDGEVVVEGVAGTFAAWSPTASEAPAIYQVCQALLDLGRACLRDAPSQTALGHLQGYLHPD